MPPAREERKHLGQNCGWGQFEEKGTVNPEQLASGGRLWDLNRIGGDGRQSLYGHPAKIEAKAAEQKREGHQHWEEAGTASSARGFIYACPKESREEFSLKQ